LNIGQRERPEDAWSFERLISGKSNLIYANPCTAECNKNGPAKSRTILSGRTGLIPGDDDNA
jgi:hypothetical protein